MAWLVWIGAGITVLGLLGLLWCMVEANRVRKAELAEDALRARLQRVVAMNMAALGCAGIGLMAVIVGIFLG